VYFEDMKAVSSSVRWQDYLEGLAQAFTPYETVENVRALPSTAFFATDSAALAKDWFWVGQDLSYALQHAETIVRPMSHVASPD
jgi:hypothetical protein